MPASRPASACSTNCTCGDRPGCIPAVPAALRGTYAGLAEPAVLDHLQRLGVTTLSLMPVQHRADEQRLLAMGLSNYWGYNTIGWFAPEARYWSGLAGTTPASEFRAMADAVHARGMELVIDVVYNHSAETDEFGPTLSLRGIDNALYYHLRSDDRALYANWTGCGNCLNLAEPRVLQLVMDSLRHWACELGVDGFRFDLAPVLGRGATGDFDPRAPFFAAVAQDPVLSRTLLIAEPWDIGAAATAWANSRRAGSNGTTATATRSAASGCARGAKASPTSAISRIDSPHRARNSPTTAARRPPASTSSPRTTASRCATWSPTTRSTTRPTAKATATANPTTARGTAAWRGLPMTRRCWRSGPGSSGTSSPPCCSRRACR
jgi:pullulanase/glycogen debranching enzyme